MVERMTLARWAEDYAERLLAPMGDRWTHVRGVAQQARRIDTVVPDKERELLLAAAYLHDIGYAPSLALTGFHALDGARHLDQLGTDRRLCSLVAHHSEARFEAEERGLSTELALYDRESGPLTDALAYADMTIGPTGEELPFTERIDEILRRYPVDHPVHRAISRARPDLEAAVERTARRLVTYPM
jgi:hypothetical protein